MSNCQFFPRPRAERTWTLKKLTSINFLAGSSVVPGAFKRYVKLLQGTKPGRLPDEFLILTLLLISPAAEQKSDRETIRQRILGLYTRSKAVRDNYIGIFIIEDYWTRADAEGRAITWFDVAVSRKRMMDGYDVSLRIVKSKKQSGLIGARARVVYITGVRDMGARGSDKPMVSIDVIIARNSKVQTIRAHMCTTRERLRGRYWPVQGGTINASDTNHLTLLLGYAPDKGHTSYSLNPKLVQTCTYLNAGASSANCSLNNANLHKFKLWTVVQMLYADHFSKIGVVNRESRSLNLLKPQLCTHCPSTLPVLMRDGKFNLDHKASIKD
ncbi:hypothetical protein B0J17DRAFT_728701 [Rhizoctonia solani]|nr:hypothetical protein B0J17DRAFT_728701 [Rhizoctonia solani]